MKNVKSGLLTLALTTAIFSVSAQTNVPEKTKAGDNWFISLGGGGNLLLGEQDHKQSVGDRIRFGGELSIGKWFNPNFGMRTQLTMGNLRGFNYIENQDGEYTRADRSRDPYPTGYYTGDLKMVDDGFWQDFSYGSMTIDLMANLTNLFRGYYRPDAPIEVIPFVGMGYLHGVKSVSNPTFDGLVTKIGTRVNFNLNPKWAIYAEPQANFMSEQFDGYVGNRGFETVVNLLVGVQYSFNKNFTCASSLSQDEINALNEKINRQHQQIENQQEILERQQRLLNELKGQSSPVASNQDQGQVQNNNSGYAQKSKGYLPEYIRFGLNSSHIEMSEKPKVEDAAAFLKANPQSKLLMIGYADKKTGNSNYNYKLSCKRADAVADMLKNLGVDSNRMIIQCVGDKEQPYDQNDWNRVVIMVER